jgi:hypothetical protein
MELCQSPIKTQLKTPLVCAHPVVVRENAVKFLEAEMPACLLPLAIFILGVACFVSIGHTIVETTEQTDMQNVDMFCLTEVIELLSIDTALENFLCRKVFYTFQEAAHFVHEVTDELIFRSVHCI